jgi:hypothetical protein
MRKITGDQIKAGLLILLAVGIVGAAALKLIAAAAS